ncbi:aldehyde ferredoxin oxidoreductase C-terminal domain-containing protein, partial [Escherichia coli]|uniref:aldehyde ferredoxin oxidoreductase C-terminal domain-containing protein n=1 Tax=Escherichia coli TaxID=562 RepID=UPI002111B8B4
MLPSETMIWQPEFTDKTLSRKPGAVQHASLTMFYKEMGWDPQLGCPTRETLQRLGLEDIAADLAAHNLLPA